MNGFALALYQHKALSTEANMIADKSTFPGFSLAYNTNSQQEVDKILTLIQEIGGTVTKEAEKTFWGGYSGYFTDPDNFLWEISYNPEFTITKEGNYILPEDSNGETENKQK